MTKQSDAFEQQIHRLVELIEDSGATVTWDEHIPDPDNPQQSRQIDISIERDSALTHVECRLHKERQDVQWIEELIGRKISLQAVSVIAVSSSGFTQGAVKKAKRHGIVLRDLAQLTEDEIRNWGCTVAMRAYYYEYKNLNLTLMFRVESLPKLDTVELADELKTYPGRQSLFNASAEELDRLNLLTETEDGKHVDFRLGLRLEGFSLCGETVEEVEFAGQAQLVSMDVNLPIALAFGEPGQAPADRSTLIKKASASETGFIIHSPDRMATILDLSGWELPPNCQFRYLRTTASKAMDMDSFEIIGGDRLYVTGGPMTVDIVGMKRAKS